MAGRPPRDEDDRLFVKRSPKVVRPSSARTKDFKVIRRNLSSRNRPASAKRSGTASKRSKMTSTMPHGENTYGRVSGQKFIASRLEMESLYESNLALKAEFNRTNEENTKLRTMLARLENENEQQAMYIDQLSQQPHRRTQTQVKKMNIIRNLKSTIKDLKQEIQKLYEENASINKNIRATKLVEMEIEMQSYASECIRLRKHLEDMLTQGFPAQGPGQDYMPDGENLSEADQEMNKYNQNALEDMRQENTYLHKALQQSQQESQSWRQKALQNDRSEKHSGGKSSSRSLRKRVEKAEGIITHYEHETNSLKMKLKQQEQTINQQQKEVNDHLGYIEHLKSEDRSRKERNSESPYVTSNRTSNKPSPPQEPQKPVSRVVEAKVTKPTTTVQELDYSEKVEPAKPSVPAIAAVPKQKSPIQVKKKVKKTLEQIRQLLNSRKMMPATFFSFFDSKNNGFIAVKDLFAGLEKQGIQTKLKRIEELAESVNGRPSTMLPISKLVDFYEQIDFSEAESKGSSVDEALEELDDEPTSLHVSTSRRAGTDFGGITETKSFIPVPSEEPANLLKMTKEDVKDLLTHISLRMQLHRLPKAKLIVSLFGKDFDKEKAVTLNELANAFKSKPFSFEKTEESITLARYLLEPQDSNMFTTELGISKLEGKAKEIGGKLFMELEEWEVFKPEDEKKFDDDIAQIISRNKLSFKECCKGYDNEEDGFINLEDFMECLETLELEFEESCLRYMILLFYSHEFDLKKVPYKQFIQAYSQREQSENQSVQEEEESSMDEEERAQIVRECLSQIADALNGRPIDKFFKPKNGRLFPNELLKGLRSLGLEDFEKNVFVVFMESLQHEEEEEELCVDFPYLASLIEHYAQEVDEEDEESGSQPETAFEPTKKEEVGEGNKHGQHVQHVSVLDTPKEMESRDKSPIEKKQPTKIIDPKPSTPPSLSKKNEERHFGVSSSSSSESEVESIKDEKKPSYEITSGSDSEQQPSEPIARSEPTRSEPAKSSSSRDEPAIVSSDESIVKEPAINSSDSSISYAPEAIQSSSEISEEDYQQSSFEQEETEKSIPKVKTPPIAQTSGDGYFSIRSLESGLVMAVQNASMEGQVPIVMETYRGEDHQLWWLKPNGYIVNKKSELVLMMRQESGKICQQVPGADNWQQKWKVEGEEIVFPQNGSVKCLACKGMNLNSGLELQDRNAGDNQKWQLEKRENSPIAQILGDGYFSIRSLDSGLVMAVQNASMEDQVAIVMETYRGEDHQLWWLKANGYIVNKKSQLVLMMRQESGKICQQVPGADQWQQKWKVEGEEIVFKHIHAGVKCLACTGINLNLGLELQDRNGGDNQKWLLEKRENSTKNEEQKITPGKGKITIETSFSDSESLPALPAQNTQPSQQEEPVVEEQNIKDEQTFSSSSSAALLPKQATLDSKSSDSDYYDLDSPVNPFDTDSKNPFENAYDSKKSSEQASSDKLNKQPSPPRPVIPPIDTSPKGLKKKLPSKSSSSSSNKPDSKQDSPKSSSVSSYKPSKSSSGSSYKPEPSPPPKVEPAKKSYSSSEDEYSEDMPEVYESTFSKDESSDEESVPITQMGDKSTNEIPAKYCNPPKLKDETGNRNGCAISDVLSFKLDKVANLYEFAHKIFTFFYTENDYSCDHGSPTKSTVECEVDTPLRDSPIVKFDNLPFVEYGINYLGKIIVQHKNKPELYIRMIGEWTYDPAGVTTSAHASERIGGDCFSMQLGVTVAQVMAYLKGCPEDIVYEIQCATLPTIMKYHERFFLHEWMGMQVIDVCYNKRDVIPYPEYLMQKVQSGELRLDSDNRTHTIEYLNSYMALKAGDISIQQLCPPGAYYAKIMKSAEPEILGEHVGGLPAHKKVMKKGKDVNYELGKVTAPYMTKFCKYLSDAISSISLNIGYNQSDLHSELTGSMNTMTDNLQSLISGYREEKEAERQKKAQLNNPIPLTEAQKNQVYTSLANFYDTGNEAEIGQIFKLFDRDGSGSIDFIELKAVLSTIFGKQSNQAVCNMMLEADSNKDGSIEVSELIAHMKKYREKHMQASKPKQIITEPEKPMPEPEISSSTKQMAKEIWDSSSDESFSEDEPPSVLPPSKPKVQSDDEFEISADPTSRQLSSRLNKPSSDSEISEEEFDIEKGSSDDYSDDDFVI